MKVEYMEKNQNSTSSAKNNDNGRQRCEVWTRVMGYYRPTFSFNVGKKGEYKTRVYFDNVEVEKNR